MVSCARATRHTGLIERLHCGRCSSTRARLRPIGLPSEVEYEQAWREHHKFQLSFPAQPGGCLAPPVMFAKREGIPWVWSMSELGRII